MDPHEEVALPRSRIGLIIGIFAIVTVVVLGAGGAYLAFARPPQLDPTRVLVVVYGGVGPGGDGPLLHGFERELRDQGFDVLRDDAVIARGDLPSGLAEARRRAVEREAASLVLLELEVGQERPAASAPLHRARLTVHVLGALPSDGDPPPEALEFVVERPSPVLAAVNVHEAWIGTLAPSVIEKLYALDAVGAAVGGEDVAMERMRFLLDLRENAPLVEDRARRRAAWTTFLETEREALAHVPDHAEGVRCTGDPARPWSVVGVSADGADAIVQEHYRTPIFSMMRGERSWTEPPEALLAVPLDGGAPRTLYRTSHFYGLARSGCEGRWLAAIETGYDVPSVVSIDTERGEVGVRWMLDRGERNLREAMPGCEGRTLLGARGGQTYLHFDGQAAGEVPGLRRAVFAPDTGAIVGQLEDGRWGSADGATSIALGGGILDAVLGARDGVTRLVIREGRACSLLTLDGARVQNTTALPLCLRDVAELADGRLVGLANQSHEGDPPGDDEVVLVDPSDRSIRVLTRGTQRDELLHVSADGRRVVFSRRMADWPPEFDVQLYRRTLCWTDVPARE